MDQDSSDICLNIVSSPFEESSSSRGKKRNKKRKRGDDKAESTANFVSRTNLGRPSDRLVSTNLLNRPNLTEQRPSAFSRPKPTTKPTTFTRPGPISSDVDGKTNTSPTVRSRNSQHIRGIGLTKKVKSSKTVTFDEEGDSGVEVERDHHYGKRQSSSVGVSSSLFGNNPEIPVFAQRVVKPVLESVFSTEHFKDLPVHPFMISNLEQNLSLTKLTTVQQKSIPVIMAGSDALIRSQTGSGKTLAYALPIVEALQKIQPKLPRSAGIQAVVVVPTRELALQTYELFIKLVKPFNWLVPGYLVGGEKRKSEKARLRKGITILIGTPGRILDHITNTEVMLIDSVKWLVLDEADRLLDMGYEKDVSSLVSAIDTQAEKNPDIFKLNESNEPTVIKRQTILVSATLTSGVERLAGLALNTPTYVDAATNCDNTTKIPGGVDERDMELSIPESLVQYYMITPPKLRLVTLSAFIISKCQFSDQRKMLVFMATQDMVDFHLELFLSVLGSSDRNTDGDEDDDDETDGIVDVEFFKLHGSMSQKDRTECFKTFRKSHSGVLLCTDVAARGLDLPHVDWIVQYTAPCSVADYVHRVGRTARVGHAGSALIFLTTTEVEFVRQLEDRRIRLREETMDKCLENLQAFSGPLAGRMTHHSPSLEAAATALQLRFEKAVMEGSGVHGLACKAYISFVRFYASFPKEGRKVFAFKNLHLGHYAKCFALRDPPSSISGIGRRKWQDDSNVRMQQKKFTTSGPNKGKSQQPMRTAASGQSRSRDLVISEYSSGMPARKKKKT